ncbi:hypothetical protein [Lacisediminihabitans sp.]|uniref:hypothetical protein n=1 Tax=Lacisediminihabitans sp. TaxID=2787631 RepID=UPI002F947EE1
MSQLRARASVLRGNGDEVRARAKSLLAQAESMSWSSSAGDALRAKVRGLALDLGSQAQVLDDAAAALEAHARAVDETKAAIATAQKLVTDAWNGAAHVASNAVEVVKDVVHTAVTGFMRVLTAVAGGDPTKVHVAVFTLGGHEIAREQVHQAKTVVGAVPALPQAGSKDWLDLSQTFRARGWQ